MKVSILYRSYNYTLFNNFFVQKQDTKGSCVHSNNTFVNIEKLTYCLFSYYSDAVKSDFVSWNFRERKWKGRGKQSIVKSLIEGNLIHLAVLETKSPGRQCLRQCFCHLLFVSVRVIHVPRARLSVARLHEHIPSDPAHYQPIQQHWSLLTWASLQADLPGPRLGLTQHSH